MSEKVDQSVAEDSASQASISRRKFLKMVAVYGLLSAIAWEAGDIWENHQEHYHRAYHELEEAKALATTLSKGLTKDWRDVSVWPGIAIIPSSVQLFSTPSLNAMSEVQWPGSEVSQHLIAQRPFMAEATAQANHVDKLGSTPQLTIGSEVMGFWMPGTNDLVYCDRATNRDRIIPVTNSTDASIYSDQYQDIAGESIHLQPAFRDHDLVYRYLAAERVYSDDLGDAGGEYESTVLFKVCGRSLWADPAQTALDYYAFVTAQGNDPIQLPGVNK